MSISSAQKIRNISNGRDDGEYGRKKSKESGTVENGLGVEVDQRIALARSFGYFTQRGFLRRY